jgi:signal peptidase I
MSEKETKKKKETEKKLLGPPKSVAREYFESFVITLIMAIFGMTFIVQAVTVPTGSMQNTILIGDYLLVNKFIFTPGGNPLPFLPQRDVERGDIIVFKYPGHPDNVQKFPDQGGPPYKINFVKRVVGLPGLHQRPASARTPHRRRSAGRSLRKKRRPVGADRQIGRAADGR